MRYEILGPIRVADDDGIRSSIGAQKVQFLLALLLIRAEHIVTVDQIIAEMWGEDIPRRAIAGVHVYVSQLRKFLARPGRTESPIITRPPGYVLRLDSDELDFRAFQHLMNVGREHARKDQHEMASASFRNALGLWRGPALSDFRDSPIVGGFATWLAEARLECIEMLTDSQLQLGQHRGCVGRLYSLIKEYPLRERFYYQLMLALYRSERQSDALTVYWKARNVLNGELGLEPCRALQDLQHAILVADDNQLRSPTAILAGSGHAVNSAFAE